MTAVAEYSPAAIAELLPYMTPEERATIDALIAQPADAPVLSFREFVDQVNPRFRWYRHCVILAAQLQRVADDEQHRLIICEPPRHGKSELVSRLFPAYYLYRHPDRWVALASYAAELAYTLSRNARANYARAGGSFADAAAAVKHWETGKGGGMWATGVGGPATGKGFHLGIIDDPVKNHEEAASEAIGRRNRDWYGAVWYTRAEPNAAMIVMQTRWPGPGDLVGYVFELEEDGEEAERWHVVSMEAEKEDTAPAIPATCTLEPDPRAVGEPLCPERYPLERLKRIAARIGAFFYAALFQQRPRARDGGMFQRAWFKFVDAAPVIAQRVRYWDKAGTEGAGNFSAGVKMSRAPDGRFYVEDVRKGQWSSAKRNSEMRTTSDLDGRAVSVWVEQEPGSGGKESAEASVKLLAGFDVHIEKVTGDKETRARPFSAQAEAGNVYLVRGPWNKSYLDELEAFPYGKYDDQVDASSGACNKLTRHGPTAGAFTLTL